MPRQKHDDRRERLGAYPRVDARPDLSDTLEAQFNPVNIDAERTDETHEERGPIPSYDGGSHMNADHKGPMPFVKVLEMRRKGAIR